MLIKPQLLITGGSGFIGGHLVKHLSSQYTITTTYWSHSFQDPAAQWIKIDLSRRSEVVTLFETLNPAWVIHTAALATVARGEKDPQPMSQINIEGAGNIAKCCTQRATPLLHFSTDMVFDGKEGNYSETDPPFPITHYGRTKLEAEKIVKHYSDNFIILRIALCLGSPIWGGSSFSQWVLENMRKNQPVHLYVDQFRTPLHIINLCQVVEELLTIPFRGILHLAGTEKANRVQIGQAVAQQYHFSEKLIHPVTITDSLSPYPLQKDLSLNVSKAKNLLKTSLWNFSTLAKNL